MPALLLIGAFLGVAWRYGRLYCGWLCPHFSLVETLNQALHRASAKYSLWDRRPTPRADRVLFAATKADHVHHTSHDRLDRLLRLLVNRAARRTESTVGIACRPDCSKRSVAAATMRSRTSAGMAVGVAVIGNKNNNYILLIIKLKALFHHQAASAAEALGKVPKANSCSHNFFLLCVTFPAAPSPAAAQ